MPGETEENYKKTARMAGLPAETLTSRKRSTNVDALFYRMSEKSGTNGNFNYYSYFHLQVKVKG
jgi:hypothetical protein